METRKLIHDLATPLMVLRLSMDRLRLELIPETENEGATVDHPSLARLAKMETAIQKMEAILQEAKAQADSEKK